MNCFIQQKHDYNASDGKFLICHDQSDCFRIPIHAITYLESKNYMVELHTAQTAYLIRVTLKELEALLLSEGFFRVHVSYLVNLHHIIHTSKNEVELDNGDKIKISRTRKNDFHQIYHSFIADRAISTDSHATQNC